MGRKIRTIAACTAALLLAALPQAASADDPSGPGAGGVRIDLKVLVVDDGGPATEAIRAELDGAGTPYTRVDLNDPNRPQITPDFLSDSVGSGPRAKYQAVVLPNDNPFGAGSAEMTAIATYESQFGIRQVDAYTFARPEVGLNFAQDPGYIGSLDGTTAQVTAAGTAGPFGYLKGSVPFEDNDPSVGESYGFLAVPLAQQAAGAEFTSFVEAPIPGTDRSGSLVGEFRHDGRSELVVNFVYNQFQQQYRLLARGIVDWMTDGVHLGADRNYFAVHVDDVFLADDRWNSELNCTPGDVDCTSGTGAPDPDPIRMTPDDARFAKSWSEDHDFTLDFAFNGGGSEDYKEEHRGKDPTADQLIADEGSFRWINHTYQHPFLGCVQDVTVVPWKCETTFFGTTRWTSQAEITSQITQNRTWGTTHGLSTDTSELVTGEHSGLKVLPQQPDDNPFLAPALAATGVTYLGSDNSREPDQRSVGGALTVPRFPMNVFYNAGHTADEVDEYNWIYTRAADGGSGVCETSGNSTCLETPLDPATGYTSYIAPLESRIALGHVLGNNPRPHYIHQSNLAEDRIAYPVLDQVLATYRGLFSDNTPLVNERLKDIANELRRRAAWDGAVKAGQVTAYRVGSTVTVTAPAGVEVTATTPAGTVQASATGSAPFGTAYAGALSGWTGPAEQGAAVTLELPQSAGTPQALNDRTVTSTTPPVPAHRTPVPRGARTQVPLGPVVAEGSITEAATAVGTAALTADRR